MRNRGDVLELAILGRLADGPLHGYELRKRLGVVLGAFRTLSFGSLYPRLRALEEKGWIRPVDTAALPHALAGRRSRVVYELTADGKERLAGALSRAEPASWDDETFDVRFSMFGETDPETRLRILEGRRTRVLERREAYRSAGTRGRERRDTYTLELQRHGLELLDREVSWLEDLIAKERSGTTDHPASDTPQTPDGRPAGREPEKENP
ncbi:transcriptional regulator, PadR-like family [Beutenbergia cavernae DSM 12333]|uniref:Transcriptional regulator, PadR-like family n=1 Tax=Beutenbergia cavernae (strain ATCC BAA-8 / DSM 12333 / CCUG 43141 / JCM 11478 / NBRC 16432 / NCIMB 13614 / HKI 0122) TaxID=471853 RepID=C5C6L4_BEUC1|nr:PadR family transcriptional regulator [Beutenbergia cavernae]ACQ82438.1 transcriptional regulator, PadR-like family [Beutenbergia cavernae DSM 12333]